MQEICTSATGTALWPAKLPSQAMSSKHVVLDQGGPCKDERRESTQAKLDALRKSGLITMPSPTRPPRSIHRSMQPITGIRIDAGLSLPSLADLLFDPRRQLYHMVSEVALPKKKSRMGL